MNDPLLDPAEWLNSSTWQKNSPEGRKELLGFIADKARSILSEGESRVPGQPKEGVDMPGESANPNARVHSDYASQSRKGELSKAGEHYLNQFVQVMESASKHPTGGLKLTRRGRQAPVPLFGKSNILPFKPNDFDPVLDGYEQFKKSAEHHRAEEDFNREETNRKALEQHLTRVHQYSLKNAKAPKPLPEPPPLDTSFEAWVAHHNSNSPENAQLDPANEALRKRVEGVKDSEKKQADIKRRGVLVEMDGDTPVFNGDKFTRVDQMEKAIDKLPVDDAKKVLIKTNFRRAGEQAASMLIADLAASERLDAMVYEKLGMKSVSQKYAEFAADPDSGSDLEFIRQHPELLSDNGFAVSAKKMGKVFETLYMGYGQLTGAALDLVGLDGAAETISEAGAFTSSKLGHLTSIYGSERIVAGVTSDALYMAAGQLMEMAASGGLAALGRKAIGQAVVSSAARKGVEASGRMAAMAKGTPAFLSKDPGIKQTIESLSAMGLYGGVQSFGLEVSGKYNDEIAAGKTPEEARARAYASGAVKAAVVAVTTGLIGSVNPGAEALLGGMGGKGVATLAKESFKTMEGRKLMQAALVKASQDKDGIALLAKDVTSAIVGHSASLGYQIWRPAQKFLYSAGSEGIEEAIQDSIGEALDALINDDKGWADISGNFVKNLPQYLDAFIVGAMMGGVGSLKGNVGGASPLDRIKQVVDDVKATPGDMELALDNKVTSLDKVMGVNLQDPSAVAAAAKQIASIGEAVVQTRLPGGAAAPVVSNVHPQSTRAQATASKAPPVEPPTAGASAPAKPKAASQSPTKAVVDKLLPLPLSDGEAAPAEGSRVSWLLKKLNPGFSVPKGKIVDQKAEVAFGKDINGSLFQRGNALVRPIIIGGAVRGYVVGTKAKGTNDQFATHEYVAVDQMKARLAKGDLEIATGGLKKINEVIKNTSFAPSLAGNDPLFTSFNENREQDPDSSFEDVFDDSEESPAVPEAAGDGQAARPQDGAGSTPGAGTTDEGGSSGFDYDSPAADVTEAAKRLVSQSLRLEGKGSTAAEKETYRKKLGAKVEAFFASGRPKEILDVLTKLGVEVRIGENEAGSSANAVLMSDDTVVVTLFERVFTDDRDPMVVLLHEAIHAVEFRFRFTPKGKKGRKAVEALLDPSSPGYDGKFAELVSKDYPKWKDQDLEVKTGEAVRTSLEALMTGRTTYQMPSPMKSYLQDLIEFTRNLFSRNAEVAEYFGSLQAILEGKRGLEETPSLPAQTRAEKVAAYLKSRNKGIAPGVGTIAPEAPTPVSTALSASFDDDVLAGILVSDSETLAEASSDLADLVGSLPDAPSADGLAGALEAFFTDGKAPSPGDQAFFDDVAALLADLRKEAASDPNLDALLSGGMRQLLAAKTSSPASPDLGSSKVSPDEAARLKARLEAASRYSSAGVYVADSDLVRTTDTSATLTQPADSTVAPPGVGDIVMIRREDDTLALDEVLQVEERTENADGSVSWSFRVVPIKVTDNGKEFELESRSRKSDERLFGRSRLKKAAADYADWLLGPTGSFTEAKLSEFIERLLKDMSSGKRSERVVYRKSPTGAAFRTLVSMELDRGAVENPMTRPVRMQPEIVIDREALIAQINAHLGYQREDYKNIGALQKQALAMQVTRMIARQLDEEVIHAVTLRTFAAADLVKFFKEAEANEMFSGLIDGMERAQGVDRASEQGQITIAAELMSHLYQLGHAGTVFSRESQSLLDLAAHIRNGLGKKSKAEKKAGVLGTIIRMVRHYSERVATVLMARNFEGRLSPFQQRILSDLAEAMRGAKQVSDFDGASRGAATATAWRRKRSLEVLDEKVKQVFIGETQGAMTLRGLARDMQMPLRMFLSFNWEEGSVGINDHLRGFLMESGKDDELALVDGYLDRLNEDAVVRSLQRAGSDAAAALDAVARTLGEVSPTSAVGKALRGAKDLVDYAKHLNLLSRQASSLEHHELLSRIAEGEVEARREEYDRTSQMLKARKVLDARAGTATGKSRGKAGEGSSANVLLNEQTRRKDALAEAIDFASQTREAFRRFSENGAAPRAFSPSEQVLADYLEAVANYNDLIRNAPSRILGVEGLDKSGFGTEFVATGSPGNSEALTMFGYDYESPEKLMEGDLLGYGRVRGTASSRLSEADKQAWDERMRAKRGNAVYLARTEHARAKFLKDSGLFPADVNHEDYFKTLGFATEVDPETDPRFPDRVVALNPRNPAERLVRFDVGQELWKKTSDKLFFPAKVERVNKVFESFGQVRDWQQSISDLMEDLGPSPFVERLAGKLTPAGEFKRLWESRILDFETAFAQASRRIAELATTTNDYAKYDETVAAVEKAKEVVKAMSGEVKLMQDAVREFRSSTLERRFEDDVRRIQVEAKSPLGMSPEVSESYRGLSFSVPTLNALEWTNSYMKDRGQYRLSPVRASELMSLWAAVQTSKAGKELFVERINEEREMSADITGASEQTVFTAEDKAFGAERERKGTSGETGQSLASDPRVNTRRGQDNQAFDLDFENRTDRDWASMAAFTVMEGNANQARRLFSLFDKVNNTPVMGWLDERPESFAVDQQALNDLLANTLLRLNGKFPEAGLMDLADSELLAAGKTGIGPTGSLANHYGNAQAFLLAVVEKISSYEQGLILEARKDARLLGAEVLANLPTAEEITRERLFDGLEGSEEGDVRSALQMDLRSAKSNQNAALAIHRANALPEGMVDVLREARVASILLQNSPEVVVYVPSRAAAARFGLTKVELVESGNTLLLVAPDDVNQSPAAMRDLLSKLFLSKWQEVEGSVHRTADAIREAFRHYASSSSESFAEFAAWIEGDNGNSSTSSGSGLAFSFGEFQTADGVGVQIKESSNLTFEAAVDSFPSAKLKQEKALSRNASRISRNLPSSVASALTDKGIAALVEKHAAEMDALEAMILRSGRTMYHTDNEAIRSTSANLVYETNPTYADDLSLVIEAFTNPEFADLLNRTGIAIDVLPENEWLAEAVRNDASNRAVTGDRFDFALEKEVKLDQASLADLAQNMTDLLNRRPEDTTPEVEAAIVKDIEALTQAETASLMGFLHALAFRENGTELSRSEIEELKAAWLSGSRDAADFLGTALADISRDLRSGLVPEGNDAFDMGDIGLDGLRGDAVLAGENTGSVPLFSFPSKQHATFVSGGIGAFRNGANPFTPVWRNRRVEMLSSVMLKRLDPVGRVVNRAKEKILRANGAGEVMPLSRWADPMGDLQALFPIVDVEGIADGLRQGREALLSEVEAINQSIRDHRQRRDQASFSAKDILQSKFVKRGEDLDAMLASYVDSLPGTIAQEVTDNRLAINSAYFGMSHWLRTRALPQMESWNSVRNRIGNVQSARQEISRLENLPEPTSEEMTLLVMMKSELPGMVKIATEAGTKFQRLLNSEIGYFIASKEGVSTAKEEQLHDKAGGVVVMDAASTEKFNTKLSFPSITEKNLDSWMENALRALSPEGLGQRIGKRSAWSEASRPFGRGVINAVKARAKGKNVTTAQIANSIAALLEEGREARARENDPDGRSLREVLEEEFVPGPEERVKLVDGKKQALLAGLDARVKELEADRHRALGRLAELGNPSSFSLQVALPLSPEQVRAREERGLNSSDFFPVNITFDPEVQSYRLPMRRLDRSNPFTGEEDSYSPEEEAAMKEIADANFEAYVVMHTMKQAASLYARERGEAVYAQVKGDTAFFRKNFDMEKVVEESMRRIGLEDSLINGRNEAFMKQWRSTDNKFGLSGTELAWVGRLGDLIVAKDGEPVKTVRSRGKFESDARTFGMTVKNSDGDSILLLPYGAKERFEQFGRRLGRTYARPGDIDKAFHNIVLHSALPLGAPGSPTPSAGHAIFHSIESFGDAFLSAPASAEAAKAVGSAGTRRELGEKLRKAVESAVPGLVSSGALTSDASKDLLKAFSGFANSLVAMFDHLQLDPATAVHTKDNGNQASILATIAKIAALNPSSTLQDFVAINLVDSYAKAWADTIGKGMLERVAAGVCKLGTFTSLSAKYLYHETAQMQRKYGNSFAAYQEVQRVIGLLHYGFDGATGRASYKAHYEEARARLAEAAKPFKDSWEAQSKAYLIASLRGMEAGSGDKLRKVGDWIRDFESGMADLLNLKNSTALAKNRLDRSLNDPNTKVMDEFEGTAMLYGKVQSAMAMFKTGNKTDADAQAFIDEAVMELSRGETPKGTKIREHYVDTLIDVFSKAQEAMRVSQLLGTTYDKGPGAINKILSTPVSVVPLRFGYAEDPVARKSDKEPVWNNPREHVALEKSPMFTRNIGRQKFGPGFRPLDLNGLVAPDRLISDAYYRMNLSHNYEVFSRIFGRTIFDRNGKPDTTPAAIDDIMGKLGHDDRVLWDQVSTDIVQSYEQTILRDKAAGTSKTNLQGGIEFGNTLYTANALLSPSQLLKQTIPPVTGMLAKKLITGQVGELANFFRALSIALSEAATGGERMSRFVKSTNIFLYQRGFDGSDAFRPQERGQKLYRRTTGRQIAKNAVNTTQEIGEKGLDLVMARGERLLVRAIYVSELFNQLNEMKANYGSEAPASIDDLIDNWGPGQIDTLAKVMADNLTTEMMGIGDKTKKARVFHWESKSPVVHSVFTGLTRFSNHVLTTSGSAAALIPKLWSPDPRMRRYAMENITGTIVQNGMYPMLKTRFLVPMLTMAWAFLKSPDDDDEELAEKAKEYADNIMKQDEDAEGVLGWLANVTRKTLFASGGNVFDPYMDGDRQWNSDPLVSFKNGMASMVSESMWEGINMLPALGPALAVSYISEDIASTKNGFQTVLEQTLNSFTQDEEDGEVGFRLGIPKGEKNLGPLEAIASVSRPTAMAYGKAESLIYLARNMAAEDEDMRPSGSQAAWQAINTILPLFREWESEIVKKTEKQGEFGRFK